MDDQPVADVDANQRSWNGAVVGPRIDALSGRNLHRGNARLEIDLDNVGICVDVGDFSQLESRVPSVRLERRLTGRSRAAEQAQQGSQCRSTLRSTTE